MSKQRNSKSKAETAFSPFQEAIKSFENFYDKSFKFDFFVADFFKSVNSAMVQ